MIGIARLGPLGRSDAPDGSGVARAAGGGVTAPGRAGTDDEGASHRGGTLSAEERAAWVVLASAHGIGPVSFGALLGAFGSAAAVLAAASGPRAAGSLVEAARAAAGRDVLSPDGVRGVLAAAADPGPPLAAVAAAGVDVVALAEPRYPARLRLVELPPPVLYLRGDAAALDRERSIAIVGTRRPTDEGRSTAVAIGEAVSALGATVVSGLALGIDAAAHHAAVRQRRPTVAVLGGGHLRLYPAAHRGLARRIVEAGGAVISEFLPDTMPNRGTFPRRNRLISGLADATVVVEAGRRSGALTTAAWALEQGRGLHLVPGRIGDPAVAGCLAFLREAAGEARVVAGVPELLEDLGLVDAEGRPRDGGGHGDRATPRPAGPASLLAALGAVERAVAEAVAAASRDLDELVAATGHSPATVLGALTVLETRGLVLDAFGRYTAAGPLATARARPAPRLRPRLADAARGSATGP